jgi:hypothetical protein
MFACLIQMFIYLNRHLRFICNEMRKRDPSSAHNISPRNPTLKLLQH